jgi:hypothetical protein
MSDINIILDGVIAFIVSASLCILLLLGIVICAVYMRATARQHRTDFTRRPVSHHIFGMSLSLACAAIILLSVILTENTPSPHTLNRWLDNWVWLWAVAVLLLWPLGAHFLKKRNRGTLHAKRAREIL